jgi:hypothetical protein
MKTTKFDVIKLIVESEQASPETFKPIFLTAVAMGAKDVYNTQADIKHVKPLLESALYLVEQIEDINIKITLAENHKLINKPANLYDHVMDLQRQKRQFTESLTNVLNKL